MQNNATTHLEHSPKRPEAPSATPRSPSSAAAALCAGRVWVASAADEGVPALQHRVVPERRVTRRPELRRKRREVPWKAAPLRAPDAPVPATHFPRFIEGGIKNSLRLCRTLFRSLKCLNCIGFAPQNERVCSSKTLFWGAKTSDTAVKMAWVAGLGCTPA